MSNSEWKEVSFSDIDIDIIDGDRGKNYPSKSELRGKGYCLFLNTKNVTQNGFSFNETFFINEDKDAVLRKGKLSRYDVILTTRGTVGNVAYYGINVPYENIRINSGMVILRAKNEVYPFFLYYLCKYLNKTYDIYSSGSVQKQLPIKDLKKITFKSPPLPKQKAIAKILSDLDEKIEVNNKINKNLEEMAQAIYKQWFVNFEFPNEDGEPYKSSGGEMIESELGLIPKGWEVKELGDYSIVKSGFAFKSKHWTDKGVGVIKIKDLNDFTVEIDTLAMVSKENASKASEFRVCKGDILIAMTGATLGKIGLIPDSKISLYVNQRVGKFFLGENPITKLPYMYGLLRDTRVIEAIKNAGEGSAQPNVSPKGIMSIKIPYNRDLINSYNAMLENSISMILDNIKESTVLSNLRDTLLPKLMSGELRVPVIKEN